MGGAGVSIYWGNVTDDIKQDQETTFFPFPMTGLSNSGDTPKIGDIIINIDGSFYRIHNIVGAYYLCSLLAISGGGGGGGAASVTRPKLMLEELDTYDLINGQDARLYFTATSDRVDDVELA
jgi:hypothetical protein